MAQWVKVTKNSSWAILMYNTLYNVEHYKGEGGINSWPNKKQTWCCHSWSHQEVPRETFKIDLAEKRSWRRDGGACLDPQKPRSCFLVKLVQLSRLSNYSHQIFAWCQSHSISFARNPHQLSLSDFLSVHNPFRAGNAWGDKAVTPFQHPKKLSFVCISNESQSIFNRKVELEEIEKYFKSLLCYQVITLEAWNWKFDN